MPPSWQHGRFRRSWRRSVRHQRRLLQQRGWRQGQCRRWRGRQRGRPGRSWRPQGRQRGRRGRQQGHGGLFQGSGGSSSGHFLFKVKSNIAKFLLDVTNNLSFSSGGEGVATFCQDLHQVVSQVSAGKIKTKDGMWKSITFIDGNSVRDTISRVKHNPSGSARSIQGEDSLDGNIHGWGVEGLKHDLGHLFTVSFGVEGSFGQEDWVFLWGNTELIVEGVVPDLLHVIPVGDDAMFNGVFEGKDTSLGLSLVSNIRVLLSHTNHHTLVTRATNNGGEDSTG